ncbi:Type-2 ice-structuring protein Type II antifreeze protein [Channa argus]|uniref:Type-2 ice-structuring protein Type II antifreeze protein n=1 Tax=Channa argus TaxID=215402 RepID=A0A6G1Q649_CHAAH|nr:Type-2 ice-structuring protein Type II antifreeze protein [Channa argus]
MKIVILCVVSCIMVVLAGVTSIWLRLGNHYTCCVVKPDLTNKSCFEDWHQFNDRCFLYIKKTMTWLEAEKNCQIMGANLTSVRSTDEYKEIQTLTFPNYRKSWIGGSAPQKGNAWRWSDGQKFDYTNWCYGEPNSPEDQRCLLMNFSEEKCWDDDECGLNLTSVCARSVLSLMD